jgi:hypothetical protein
VEGIAGSYAIQAVHHYRQNNQALYQAALQKLLGLQGLALAEKSDEILYGRAGYLLACRFVENDVPGSIPTEVIQSIIDKTIEVGKQCVHRFNFSHSVVFATENGFR